MNRINASYHKKFLVYMLLLIHLFYSYSLKSTYTHTHNFFSVLDRIGRVGNAYQVIFYFSVCALLGRFPLHFLREENSYLKSRVPAKHGTYTYRLPPLWYHIWHLSVGEWVPVWEVPFPPSGRLHWPTPPPSSATGQLESTAHFTHAQ